MRTMDEPVEWRSHSVKSLPGSGLPALQHLAQLLIASLGRAKLKIAVAESCSVGALAHSLSKADGASDVFGGFVTYMARGKTQILGVPANLIAAHSAVSSPVTRALAKGVLASTPSDLALAITGVTGSIPDEYGNPRGRIFIAAAMQAQHGIDCHCEFGDFPPSVLLDAALRTALSLGLELPNIPPPPARSLRRAQGSG
jgi:nicotinamide-nucleotide amidase